MPDRIDLALDALDAASEASLMHLFDFGRPKFSLEGDSRNFMSVQEMSERLGCSDTTSRGVIHRLIDQGLAEAFRVVGADGVQRILVTGESR